MTNQFTNDKIHSLTNRSSALSRNGLIWTLFGKHVEEHCLYKVFNLQGVEACLEWATECIDVGNDK